MDAERALTLIIISFLVDNDIVQFATVCGVTFVIAEPYRDIANTRRLLAQLRLLAEITGGETTSEVRAAEDAAGHAYFLTHIATDWDLSD